MRMRHIAKTDPDMDGDRKQVSYRLSRHYRQRIKEVKDQNLPDLHSESDIMQDAIWLWFHEHDLMVKKGLIRNGESRETEPATGPSGHRVHADTGSLRLQAPGVEVGDPAQAGESRAG